MGLVLVTPPAIEPMTLAEAKVHLREDGDDQDEFIEDTLIGAARQSAEIYLRRALITQSWRLTLDAFPNRRCFWGHAHGFRPIDHRDSGRYEGEIELPNPPLIAVTSFTYVDTNGVTQDLVEDVGFVVDTNSEPGRVVPVYGTWWPFTRRQPGAVQIEFDCGYGEDADAVPPLIKKAIGSILGNMYENRETVTTGALVAQMPSNAEEWLDNFRLFSFV